MIYECETCETVLGPGMTLCPRCGRVFDEPVPADALWDEPAADAPLGPAAPPAEAVGLTILAEAALTEPELVAPPEPPRSAPPVSPEVIVTPRRKTRSRRWPLSAVSLALLGLGWLGYRQWVSSPAPEPAPYHTVPLPTDLAAHPQYTANMNALVQKLRATGVGAEWPAFGSDDTLVITPQARAAEPPVVWDADMSRRLAQGVYGEFAQTRFESGFPDRDTTACFVVVTGAKGQVVAVDFMGRLE